MSLSARIDRWWRPPVPAERLGTLRVFVGGFALVYVIARAWHLARCAGFNPAGFRPVGPVALLDAPLPEAVVWALVGATVIFGVAFVAGWRFRWTGWVFAALLLWVTSYRSSWGMIFHTENLLAMHVIVLALAPSAAAVSLDARRRGDPDAGRVDAAFGWPIMLVCAVTCATYFIAGVAKLDAAGLDWANGDILRNQIAYDTLKKDLLGHITSPLGHWLIGVDWVFPPLAALTLIAEVFAPVALVWRRVGLWLLAILFAFHWGVLAIMAIVFAYPLSGIAFASFFQTERALAWRWMRPIWRAVGVRSS